MSGIYGDTILAFPEQMVTLTAYQMTPDINAGYTMVDGSSKTVRGIFQNSEPDRIKDGNGNLIISEGFSFWTADRTLAGWFTTIDGNVYRLVGYDAWNREGGFVRYILERVVGNNGTQSDDASWNTGVNSFG